jgi:hypothetical protein
MPQFMQNDVPASLLAVPQLANNQLNVSRRVSPYPAPSSISSVSASAVKPEFKRTSEVLPNSSVPIRTQICLALLGPVLRELPVPPTFVPHPATHKIIAMFVRRMVFTLT